MKKLKLNLNELSRELEILDIDYLKGIKGGYGTPDGGYGDYGSFGGYGTPDDPIELEPVEIYGNYGGGGSNPGTPWFPWLPPYDPGGNGNYLPGMGGGTGGYGGYGEGYLEYVNAVNEFLSQQPVQQISNTLNAMGLTNAIQQLNHNAINQLIIATGGEPVTELVELANRTGLGKICAIGTVFDSVKTIVAFSDGDITSDDWLSLTATVGGFMSFIPGPVGVIGAGITVGIAIWEYNDQ